METAYYGLKGKKIMKFTYCPHCGTRLTEKEIGDEGLVPYCGNCRIPLFDMFSTCIIALVVNEKDEALLLRQSYISNHYYNLVSGYMKPGERAEEAAVREIAEETGVAVDRLEFVGTYWFGKKDMLMIGFFARAKKQEPKLSGEVDAAEWVPVTSAIEMVHPSGSVSHTLVEKYIRQESMGFPAGDDNLYPHQ